MNLWLIAIVVVDSPFIVGQNLNNSILLSGKLLSFVKKGRKSSNLTVVYFDTLHYFVIFSNRCAVGQNTCKHLLKFEKINVILLERYMGHCTQKTCYLLWLLYQLKKWNLFSNFSFPSDFNTSQFLVSIVVVQNLICKVNGILHESTINWESNLHVAYNICYVHVPRTPQSNRSQIRAQFDLARNNTCI